MVGYRGQKSEARRQIIGSSFARDAQTSTRDARATPEWIKWEKNIAVAL